MKAYTFTFPVAAALVTLGAGCSSTPEYTQYPAQSSQYPAQASQYPSQSPQYPQASQYPSSQQYPASQYPAEPASTDKNQTARGAVAGAATGAIIGGIVGNNSQHGTEKGAVIGAVAGGLAGAAIGHRADQRESNAGAPVYSAADAGYAVQSVPQAPVSEPQESIPPQPAANAVWIRGHYVYAGTGYQWQPGRWEIAPPGARNWVGPSWQPAANGGYVYVRGHWQ